MFRTVVFFALAGCFTPEATPLEIETLPYETDYTTIDDLVIQPFEYPGLYCPDGQPANFFAVYQPSLTDPAPIVVVFHSGTFDYVLADSGGYVLPPDAPDAQHYQGTSDRLSADWASEKVFETLGLLGEDLDPNETHLGTLPAALAEAGAFALYPSNCWADLWHNELGSTPNRYDSDGGVDRNGRFLAWAMTSIASSDPTTAAEWKTKLGIDTVPIPLDASGVYLAGLGEGGRAVAELYRRSVPGTAASPVKGIIIDSTMDNLFPIVSNDATFKAYNDGVARIFPDNTDDDGDGVVLGDNDVSGYYRDDIVNDIGYYSLARVFTERALSVPLVMYYSSSDPYLPSQAITSLTSDTFVDANAGYLTLVDVAKPNHVFINADQTLARQAVSTMFGQ